MVVRCTRRMLGLLGRDVAVADPAVSKEDWYANAFWVERRKCVLLVHAGSLFSVVALDIRVSELRPWARFVARVVEDALGDEGLPVDVFGLLDPDAVLVARTASRSVLGSMNDMAFHVEHMVFCAGGVDLCDARQVGRQLRRTPYGALRYGFPLDHVAARLDRN